MYPPAKSALSKNALRKLSTRVEEQVARRALKCMPVMRVEIQKQLYARKLLIQIAAKNTSRQLDIMGIKNKGLRRQIIRIISRNYFPIEPGELSAVERLRRATTTLAQVLKSKDRAEELLDRVVDATGISMQKFRTGQ